MRQIVDRLFPFHGLGGCESQCRLRVYEDETKPTVVIATELSDNPGTSITNAAADLATEVWKDLEFPARRMVWIENYPQDGDAEKHSERERYAIVTFRETRQGFVNPQWKYLTKEDVERLIEQPLEDPKP